MNVQEMFGHTGPFANAFAGYNQRPGQVAMASVVETAIEHRRPALIEAPTGTGKSVGYLAPIIASGKRAIIATANIGLQEQLIKKDLPMLHDVLSPYVGNFTYALLKGINNYVCKRDLEALLGTGTQGSLFTEEREKLPAWLREWAETTEDGDKSHAPELPDNEDWALISTDSEGCTGESCPFHNECHAIRAKKRAKKARIIVTNYHMLMIYMALQGSGIDVAIAEDVGVLVLDEAHKAADIARDFFGIEITPFRIDRIAKTLERHELGGHRALRAASTRFFRELDQHTKLKHLHGIDLPSTDGLVEALRSATGRLRDDPREGVAKHASAAAALTDELLEAGRVETRKENTAYYIELVGKKRSPALCGKPVDVSQILRAGMWEPYPTVVATSATLTVRSSFKYIRSELGAPEETIELETPSPFNYERQCLLVMPELPDGNSQSFTEPALQAIEETVAAAGGRTLGLFTSYAMMQKAADRLRGCGYTVLVQGQGLSRQQLVARFKEDVSSVLLGVESFWAGVDVPGEALSCVIIDKIPFTSPDEPVMNMRNRIYGSRTFYDYFVPSAVIQFKQGFGRLIRDESDRGVCVLLDGRLRSKGYGSSFMRSLPDMDETTDISKIRLFLEGNHSYGNNEFDIGATEHNTEEIY